MHIMKTVWRAPLQGLAFVWLVALLGCSGTEGKQSEESNSSSQASSETSSSPKKEEDKKVVLFFGDSITEGVGVRPKEAFPFLVGQMVDSLGLPYKVVNAGLGGETTSGGLTRLEWVLDQYVVDVFVLELGGNDGLRGIDPAASRANLQAIIDRVRTIQPQAQIVLAGMEAPPSMGQAYTREFRSIFPSLAEQNDLVLIPFILEGVAGNPALNLEDGIHPTARGHEYVAAHVWHYIMPLLKGA